MQHYFLKTCSVFLLLCNLTFSYSNELYQYQLLEYASKLPDESRACVEEYLPFYLTAIEQVVEMEHKGELAQLYKPCRQIYKNESFYLKRRDQHIWIDEMLVWDLSLALGSFNCVVPSFAVSMLNKRHLILQKNERLTPGPVLGWGLSDLPNASLLKTISLETYWEAFLFAYLAGLNDLAPQNIGIDDRGRVRFFDNEHISRGNGFPIRIYKNRYSFAMDFLPTSLDWPHAKLELSKSQAKIIQDMIFHWERQFPLFLTRLGDYPIKFDERYLKDRIEKLVNFPVKKGTTFLDFFAYIYPIFDVKYHKDLIALAKTVHARTRYIGTALLSIQTKQHLSEATKERVDAFIRQHYLKYPLPKP